MKIILFNEFSTIPGGVDRIVNLESKELAKTGSEVILFYYQNAKFQKMRAINKISVLLKSFFGNLMLEELQELIDNYNPDIIHFHNIYHLFGTPIWDRIDQRNAQIVLHLHNYHPFCLNSFFCFRTNFCARCLASKLWILGILRKCYNNSYLTSFYTSAIRISPQKWIDKLEKVSLLVAVSSHSAGIYKKIGTPYEKITIIPNAVEPYNINNSEVKGEYILYLGNIRKEKGIMLFLNSALNYSNITFIAVGDGPDLKLLKKAYSNIKNLIFTGYKSGNEKIDLIRKARFLFSTSICFETFGITVIEAYSCGIPILTTASGGIEEIFIEGMTGRLYKNLSSVRKFWDELDTKYLLYKRNCLDFSKKFRPEGHVKLLLSAYRRILI